MLQYCSTVLAVGGTVAAFIQMIGYASAAGGIMLAANIIVIAVSAWARHQGKKR